MQIISFTSGPHIRLTLEFEELKLKKTSLSLSDGFECEMIGRGGDQLKTDLLTFLENYTKHQVEICPLPLDKLSPFRQKVLSSLQRVPFGSVVTYGELADLSGFPRAARAVGSTCNHNPYPLFIPCHRVIAQGRKTGGFAFNIEIKKRLLDFEENYLLGSGSSKIMRS